MAQMLQRDDEPPSSGCWPPAIISYALALTIRNAALSICWHAANTRAGFAKDAARDLREFQEHCAQIKRLEIVPASAPIHIERMFTSMAWHAANLRKSTEFLEQVRGGGYRKDADKNGEDFEDAKAALTRDIVAAGGGASSSAVVLELDVVELLASLASAAAWFTTNSRAKFSRDAKRDLAQLVRTFNCLYVRRRDKWFGVNLGGCRLPWRIFLLLYG